MNSNTYCVIMAGGVGSRFWPLSRTASPKQFIDILGTGKTLIRQTFERFQTLCPVENFYVVTNIEYKDKVLEQIPELDTTQVLLEPMRRNTAPCIAYANWHIKVKNPKANIIVAPSDHLILKEEKFISVIKEGIDFVNKNNALLTLGIKPHRPDTGYGYIQIDNTTKKKNNNITKVKTFTEKPNLELAEFFLESGEFYWNSGLFIWSLKSIDNAFEKHLPDINSLFKEGLNYYNTPEENNYIDKIYSKCKNISIDFGIMEKSENVYVLCSDFGWSDLGTWGSLYEHCSKDGNKNAVTGNNVMIYDTKNCIINMPEDKLVVLQGLNNYIIVESEGVLLVCKKGEEQKIKQIVNDIKINKGEKFI